MDSIKEKIANLSDKELQEIIEKKYQAYQPKILKLVREELSHRNINFTEPDLERNESQHGETLESPSDPGSYQSIETTKPGVGIWLSNRELRLKAREVLKGRWGEPVLVSFLFFVVTFFSNTCFGLFTYVLVQAPLTVGLALYALKFARKEETETNTLFEAFNHFGAFLGIFFLRVLFEFLWTLLLIVPGIIKGISYSMSFYLVADNPKIGAKNALNYSKKMTKGHKGEIFFLILSFSGWFFLSILTCGLGFLWLTPYFNITFAFYYDQLKERSIANGICTAEEFLFEK